MNQTTRVAWLRKRFEHHSPIVQRIVADLTDEQLLAMELKHTIWRAEHAEAVKPEPKPSFTHTVELIVTKAMKAAAHARNRERFLRRTS